MYNIYCLSFVYNCSTDCVNVSSNYHVILKNTYVHVYYRKCIFNHTQHFLHLNLSIALLLGLITFVSGIETAAEYRVSGLVIFYIYVCKFCFVLLRKAALLWLYCCTIYSWQHFAGCSVKECYYSSCCILSFIKDFLKVKSSFSQLDGVRKHTYVCMQLLICTVQATYNQTTYVCGPALQPDHKY